jgi:hypothetical protein
MEPPEKKVGGINGGILINIFIICSFITIFYVNYSVAAASTNSEPSDSDESDT